MRGAESAGAISTTRSLIFPVGFLRKGVSVATTVLLHLPYDYPKTVAPRYPTRQILVLYLVLGT